MKFTFVRHGEIEEPSPGLAETGHDDPALTAYGRRQAAAIASELFEALDRGSAYEAIYTSPLRAARMTAEALAAVLDAGEPRVAHELATLTPEVLPADGGREALEAIQERAWSALQVLKDQFEAPSTIVMVSHDLTIRSLVCKALDMPLAEMHRFDLEPASLTTIEFRLQGQRDRVIIANLNETCHLERDGP